MADAAQSRGRRMRLIYIAGQYRGTTLQRIRLNIEAARFIGVLVIERGHYPVIPHSNTSEFDDLVGVGDELYLDGTLELMRRCDGVVMVPGWKDSRGAVAERNEALTLRLPIFDTIEELTHAEYWPGLPPASTDVIGCGGGGLLVSPVPGGSIENCGGCQDCEGVDQ